MCAPDYVGPFVGWRLWRTVETPAGLRLQSLFHESAWPPGEPLRAVCLARRSPRLLLQRVRRRQHYAPDASCSCGVYAAEPELLLEQIERQAERYVVGRVRFWGRVVECELGWRAEFAYPAHIYVPAGDDAREVLAGLAVYGVSVEQSAEPIPPRLLAAVS